MPFDRLLLRFKHVHVLFVDTVAVVDVRQVHLRGPALVVEVVVAHEVPEVVAAALGFRRDRSEEEAADALRAVAFRRAGAGNGDADVAGDGRRRLEVDDVPAVHETLAAQLPCPERRRVDVLHPAGDGHFAVGVADFEGDAGDGFVPDAAGVHVGLVSEVHEVVDHELVIALEAVERAAFAGPGRIVVPVEVGNKVGVGQRRVARPDPYQAVAFDSREGADAGRGVHRLLRGHVYTAAVAVEFQAVVAAHEIVAVELAHRQRQQAVPAGVLQRDDVAISATIEHQLLVAQGSFADFVLDFVVPGSGVPGILGE
ncbi:MAG: hypothetical protein P8Z69_08445 [Acidihalobacter sp.]